jgi:membrane protein DedA with SNARE-associated domain
MRLYLRLTSLILVLGIAHSSLQDSAFFSSMSDSFWTYVTMGASSIIMEEIAPIFGGIAAHEGQLRLDRVIVAITFGGWTMAALLYWVGRLKWDMIRKRWPGTRATGTVALRVVRRNPLTASFFVRFAFGLRIVLPLACGAARVSLPIYLISSLLGSFVWSTIFALLGYAAGEAAVRVVGHLGQAGEIVGALLVASLVFVLVWLNRRRRARKELRRLPRILQ